jgi:integrase
MGRKPGPDVSIWSVYVRNEDVPRPFVARWKVSGKVWPKAFESKALAEDWLSRLRVARNDGERFDPATGLPEAWGVEDPTVAEWAARWFQIQAPSWRPRSRQSSAEVLTKALPILVGKKAPQAPATLGTEIRRWLADDGVMPKWLQKWSLPMSALTKPLCEEAAVELYTKKDGTLAAGSTMQRNRSVVRAMLADAVESGVLHELTWPGAPKGKKRAANRVRRAVDVKQLPNPVQARQLIDALVSHQPASHGYRVIAASMFFAGMRPSEAMALPIENCTLPADDVTWGSVFVDVTICDAGDLWTKEGEEEGDPKSFSREVPIPPELVAILRTHIGERTAGHVIENTPSSSNFGRAFRKARGANAWRPYDLRHAAATLWISSGVPLGTAAHRMGHSVTELTETYLGVLSGDDETANQRIAAALR